MLAQLLIRHYAVRDSKVFGMVISTGGQKSARGAYLFRFLKIECIQLILIKIKISYISKTYGVGRIFKREPFQIYFFCF